MLGVYILTALLVATGWAQRREDHNAPPQWEDHNVPFNYSGYEILNVEVHTEERAAALREFSENYNLDLWNEPRPQVGYSLLQVPPELKTIVKSILRSEGFNPTTAIGDYQKAIDKEREENSRPHEYKRSIAGFDYGRYRTLNEINNFLNQVAQEYPNLAKVVNIGSSFEGKSILGIQITAAAPGTKPVVFIECGIHSREWVSIASALYFIGQLTTKSTDQSIQTLINNFEWHIFPSVNPDGYVYTHTINRSWRKTRSRSRVQPTCYGADPNRNFDTAFCSVGASKTPCSDTYCGDSAFSEKETQALRDYTRRLGSRIKVYFGVHSFSQLWMYPYGYTTRLAANNQRLADIATKSVASLTKVYGTRYRQGPIATAIYLASGSSVDWVYDSLGVKVAYALELRDTGRFGFLLPANQIVPTALETFEGIKTTVLNA